jgi:hypothetical protein
MTEPVEDSAPQRQGRKVPMLTVEMPAEKLARIAASRMDPEHNGLNALMAG